MDDLRNGRSPQEAELSKNGDRSTALETGSGHGRFEVRRALLLVGSPKTRKSNSNSPGGYLIEGLSAVSIETDTLYLLTALRAPERVQARLDAADLVTLAFPLFVDSLPAPVIEALERTAVHRQGRTQSHRQLLTAIANCGFPEAYHCTTALAIGETCARQAGFEWAGSLALGGGEMVNGASLTEAGGRTIRIRQSLDVAGEALAQGQAIPQPAHDILGKPVVPRWAYRLIGDLGWLQRARHHGALKSLRRKP